MTLYVRLQPRSACYAMAISLMVVHFGCSAVPREYIRMAEPGMTLTTLAAHPEVYRGKVVILGGVIIEEEVNEQHLWLRLKNLPLDVDYHPHRPSDSDGPDAGDYWVMVGKQQLPHHYRQWARMTVVGQVTGTKRFGREPVLSLLYVRGWGMSSAHDGVWQKSYDPNYLPEAPEGIGGEFSGR